MTVLYILEAAIGIGLLIFFHEMGHFLMCRWVGVRVEVFSLGFGPRLIGFKRGATDYRISAVPFGGYVKMAGENVGMQGTGAPDEFPSKSVGARALIASGGVLMNVVTGMILFILAFAVGVKFFLPEIGHIPPGSDAQRVGLRKGDRVLSIGGDPVSHFQQVRLAIAYAKVGQPLEMVVERDGPEGIQRIPIVIEPDNKNDQEIPDLEGLVPALYTHIDGVASGSAAARAVRASDGAPYPLRKGDLVTSAAGRRLEPWDGVALRQILFDHPGETIPVTIRRGVEVTSHLDRDGDGGISPRIEYSGGEEVELRMTVAAYHPYRLGAFPEEHPIVTRPIPEGAPAHGILRMGDVILRVQGEDSRTRSLMDALRYGRGEPVDLLVQRDGEELEVTLTPAFSFVGQYMVGVEYTSAPVVGEILPDSPASRADLRKGDHILKVEKKKLPRWLSLESYAAAMDEEYTLEVQRGEEILPVSVEPEPVEDLAYGHGGVLFTSPRFTLRSGSIVEAATLGVRGTYEWIGKVFLTIRRLASQDIHAKNLGGIVMIADTSYRFATLGLGTMLFFLGIISVNLAILNILPIPILDGGLLFFLLIEKIKGSPVQEKYMVIANYVGLALLLTLMVYVTYNDITRIIVR